MIGLFSTLRLKISISDVFCCSCPHTDYMARLSDRSDEVDVKSENGGESECPFGSN